MIGSWIGIYYLSVTVRFSENISELLAVASIGACILLIILCAIAVKSRPKFTKKTLYGIAIWIITVILMAPTLGKVQESKPRPNHALEPTTLSVTFRAPSRTDRAS